MEKLNAWINEECGKLRQDNCESARVRIDELERTWNQNFSTKEQLNDGIEQRMDQLGEEHDELVVEYQNNSCAASIGIVVPIDAEIVATEIQLIEDRINILQQFHQYAQRA